MSWSVSAKGKKPAVAAAVDSQFNSATCQEPEQSLKEQARALVAALMTATEDTAVLSVEAAGTAHSIAVYGDPERPNAVTEWKQLRHSIKISVEPIWGFVE